MAKTWDFTLLIFGMEEGQAYQIRIDPPLVYYIMIGNLHSIH